MHAIESEMYLLQAVRGSRVDPYYAYRLGVLGALVAEVSAPLYGTNPTYRNLYYADVEGNIDRVQLQSKRRVAVDPASYLSEVTSEAQGRADLIVSDYKSGLGFKGVAGAALSEDASRSVNAVADVMLTVLRGQVTVTNLSQGQIRDYVVDAIRFYIARNNDAETEAAYAKLMDLGVTTVDLQKQIGDMFYDAEKFERAMQEYKSVLAQAPSRRDVIERIADYYVRQGDDALSEKDLEGALASYNDALEADMLHPSAQSKKLEAQAMITERDARLEAQRRSLGQGDDLLRQADSLIFKQEYTEALTLLRQASTSYGEVTDEFPTEAQLARRGLLNATQRISQLQRDVVANAGSLSGLGATTGLRADAVEAAASVDQAALRQLVEAQYQAELAKLRAEYTAQ
jgi:tetratricopeptide (TPR) repeat protein